MNNFLRNLWDFLNDISLNLGEVNISLIGLIQLIVFLLLIVFLIKLLQKPLKNRLLKSLGIQQSSREAIANLITYSLGALGFIIILQTVGINLSALAVIGGGIGIGIGFGLQDFTKNFVSGITIAFENKIKTDDFIELDNIKGFIEEISTRSTTIRQFNGSRVIVPNSQLVEKFLNNWSYQPVVSISTDVEVASDSDLNMVVESLMQAAYNTPYVLEEELIRVFFTGFGDTCFNFRVWISISIENIDKKDWIESCLNHQIARQLRKFQVSLSTPQRNLWLLNAQELTDNYQPPVATPLQISSICDLFKKTDYFRNFNDFQLVLLLERGYARTYLANTIVFQEGDTADNFYIILSGSVEVYVEKTKKVLNTMEAGSFFGELALLLNDKRTASIRTLEPTELFMISKKSFERLLKSQPELASMIIEESKKHKEELIKRRAKMKELGLLDPEEDEENILSWFAKRFKDTFNL